MVLPDRDPRLTCIACGADFFIGDFQEVLEVHEQLWSKIETAMREKKPLLVPASEIEEVEFEGFSCPWAFFYRSIIHDPKTNTLRLSGMRPLTGIDGPHPPIPNDPGLARLLYSHYRHAKEDGENSIFHMANILGPDRNWKDGKRIGYPLHVPCWLLLDRVIGHDLILQDLRKFIRSARSYWKANRKSWAYFPSHDPDDEGCHEDGVHWLRPEGSKPKPEEEMSEMELMAWCYRETRSHETTGPLRIPGIRELIAQVTLPCDERATTAEAAPIPAASKVSIEVAVMIVDLIYWSQGHSYQRIQDIKNTLDAFGWKLPRTYWKSKCNPDLIFEVEDLFQQECSVDWARLCLGIEELMLDESWYCESGLAMRSLALKAMNEIKERFLKGKKRQR